MDRLNLFFSSKNGYRYVLIFGSLVVSLWTLFRFFIKQSVYDLVGQQLLMRQWSHGFHYSSMIGATNYILKMVFIYLPAQYLPGSPRLKLILMTLFINVVTFILLVILIRKIYFILTKDAKPINNLVFLWLALLSGSVYWIEFSNSRNLEVVGGMFLVYLVLSLKQKHSLKKLLFVYLFSILLFFADPLQAVMTAVPVFIFYVITLFVSDGFLSLLRSAKLGLVLASSYLSSIFVSRLVEKLTGTHLISAGSYLSSSSVLTYLVKGPLSGVKQLGRLFVGGHEYGSVVEGLNLLIVFIVLAAFLFYVLKKKASSSLLVFVSIFLFVDVVGYVLSGQAELPQTSRYLIMCVPPLLLIFINVLSLEIKLKKALFIALLLVVVINLVTLLYIFTSSLNKPFSSDSHQSAMGDYIKNNKLEYAYGGMYASLTEDYYSGGKVVLLPLGCGENGQIAPANLFFDFSYFKYYQSKNTKQVPIIFDGRAISNVTTFCGLDAFISKLGSPVKTDKLSDGSLVLYYSKGQLSSLLVK